MSIESLLKRVSSSGMFNNTDQIIIEKLTDELEPFTSSFFNCGFNKSEVPLKTLKMLLFYICSDDKGK